MAESNDFDWKPPLNIELKLLEAQRERKDQISKIMGDYLLKGYKMLATSCEKCGTILLRTKQGEDYCINCREFESDANKDDPSVNFDAAQRQAEEALRRTYPNGDSSHYSTQQQLHHHSDDEDVALLPNMTSSSGAALINGDLQLSDVTARQSYEPARTATSSGGSRNHSSQRDIVSPEPRPTPLGSVPYPSGGARPRVAPPLVRDRSPQRSPTEGQADGSGSATYRGSRTPATGNASDDSDHSTVASANQPLLIRMNARGEPDSRVPGYHAPDSRVPSYHAPDSRAVSGYHNVSSGDVIGGRAFNVGDSIQAVQMKLHWATCELNKSSSVDNSIHICNLIQSCAQTLDVLRRIHRDSESD